MVDTREPGQVAYRGLADALHRGDHEEGSIGRATVLPSSFTGGPRYMQQHYQDAMALRRHFGKPDLFRVITITCNPNWREIKESLLPTQQPHDRQDLCARVFHLKEKALMADLTDHWVFGKVVAHLHVIEFQKRGLPHAHSVIIIGARQGPRAVRPSTRWGRGGRA